MTDLTPYLDRPDILNETAMQVVKDFGMTGLKINFSGRSEGAYSELFFQILPLIEKLLKEDAQHFYSLMYRIDISEEQIKKEAEKSADRSFAEVITDLVLKRELLKVVIRMSYSAGKGL